jgi:hypothetical protein
MVRELGGLLSEFLKDTEAVIPKVNPNYRKQETRPKSKLRERSPAADSQPGDAKKPGN